ncbi:MAG: hypothetical protein BWY61_00623 [Firmicutes bacterium ADurb.Bin354]|nr:MAG: hypothetical protein BWY61_00623 [Firmicutes bacterium ADurb.Bin354]
MSCDAKQADNEEQYRVGKEYVFPYGDREHAVKGNQRICYGHHAAFKPGNTGLPESHDAERKYCRLNEKLKYAVKSDP